MLNLFWTFLACIEQCVRTQWGGSVYWTALSGCCDHWIIFADALCSIYPLCSLCSVCLCVLCVCVFSSSSCSDPGIVNLKPLLPLHCTEPELEPDSCRWGTMRISQWMSYSKEKAYHGCFHRRKSLVFVFSSPILLIGSCHGATSSRR